MSRMIAVHKYLIILSEYEVEIGVYSKASPSSFECLSLNTIWPEELLWAVNFLNVACKTLVSYHAIGSFGLPNRFLLCNQQSLRCEFILTIYLQKFVCLKVDEYDNNGMRGIEGLYGIFCHQPLHEIYLNDLLQPKIEAEVLPFFEHLNIYKWEIKLIAYAKDTDKPSTRRRPISRQEEQFRAWSRLQHIPQQICIVMKLFSQ